MPERERERQRDGGGYRFHFSRILYIVLATIPPQKLNQP